LVSGIVMETAIGHKGQDLCVNKQSLRKSSEIWAYGDGPFSSL
jgi:hypothetical protein